MTEGSSSVALQRATRHTVRTSRRAIVSPGHIASHALLVLGGIIFVLPFVWLVLSSLKSSSDIFHFPPTWLPHPVHWSNYPQTFSAAPFARYFLNTFIVSVGAVVGTVISCSIVAYAFGCVRWPGRDAVFLLVLSTMMLPFQVTMIPLYVLFHWLHWTGTFLPLIVPHFFGEPFFIFLLRQFFISIPRDLLEAGRIDGCSEFGLLWRVVVPLARPALTTTAVLSFIWAYTDYLGPLIYLNDEKYYTISVGLASFVGLHTQQWNLLMAGSVLALIPTLIIYAMAQKQFITGIQTTGMQS